MAQKKAFIRNIQGITFSARSDSNHWIVMDGPANFGGSDAATRPKELMLIALGGCTASDVASLMRKRRAPMIGFEVYLTGNEAAEHPRVFTDIHIEFVFYGDGIDKADIERAIDLSATKYCSVSAMLKDSVKITHSYRVEPASAFPK